MLQIDLMAAGGAYQRNVFQGLGTDTREYLEQAMEE